MRPARGNEKGRVERQIRYLRDSFFAARTFTSIADLQRQFCAARDSAHMRTHPDDKTKTVADVLEQERRVLVPLPEHAFDTTRVIAVRVEKQPYVRFDGNRYSVPHSLVRKSVTLVATFDLVRVLDGTIEMARHERSWSKGEVIEDQRHVDALWNQKRAASGHRGRSRLLAAVPRVAELLVALADRNEPLAAQTRALNQLLDVHGPDALRRAVDEAIERQTPRAASVAHLLAVDQRESARRPTFSVTLPDRSEIRDLRVVPHALETYDDLTKDPDSER